ncbi:MAG: HEAT repeat domain-containing protein, partial [Planctomycetota bacterium]
MVKDRRIECMIFFPNFLALSVCIIGILSSYKLKRPGEEGWGVLIFALTALIGVAINLTFMIWIALSRYRDFFPKANKLLISIGVLFSLFTLFILGCQWFAAGTTFRPETYNVKELLDGLNSSNWNHRHWCIQELGLRKVKKSVPMLIEILLKDKDDRIRWKAVEALGEIRDVSSLDALEKSASDDPSKSVRELAINAIKELAAIKELKVKESVPMLVEILQKDKDYRCRAKAAEALGEIKDV